jgi:hypothetical protein
MPMPQTTPPISWLCEGLGVDDRAAGCHLEGARDADGPQVRIHLHLDELRAARQRCVLPALLRGARLKRLGDLSEAMALHDFGDADDTRRVAFESQPAVEHLDVGGGSPLQLSIDSDATTMAGFADQEDVRLRCDVLTKTRQPELHRASCKPHPNLVAINPVRPSVRRG